MNNPVGKQADRSEEVAFLVLEAVLGVQIFLADSNGTNGCVDGRWGLEDGIGIVEITGPPAEVELRAFAIAERSGERWVEARSVDRYHNQLAEYLSRELTKPWSMANVAKLTAIDAKERHLFLLGRTMHDHEYYARLSDTYTSGPVERINPLNLPSGISDVWFLGRASRGETSLGVVTLRVARFNRRLGWSTHAVSIDEQRLPAPKSAVDPAPDGWRLPQRNRDEPAS